MKKLCLVLLFILAPSIVWAQGGMTVSNVHGSVLIRHPKAEFVRLSDAVPRVQVGDQIKTGADGYATLTLPDGSYMVVTPNSSVTIDDRWSSGLRNIANILAGKVRFWINNLGDGKPNPIRVGTPTALIAVRGTIFEVSVDDAQQTEVWCLEHQVGVVSSTLNDDREVVLDAGKHTLVRNNEHPSMPVDHDVPLPNRSIKIAKKDSADANKILKSLSLPEAVARDNDRSSRPSSGAASSPSTTVDPSVGRAKPTLTFP
jgi:hypothetical protein